MFWNKKAPEPPLNSAEYEKLSNLIIDLNNKIALLKGDLTGVLFEFEKVKSKLNQRAGKKEEEPPKLPEMPKGLNSFNPFL
jgi:hypothetical protein